MSAARVEVASHLSLASRCLLQQLQNPLCLDSKPRFRNSRVTTITDPYVHEDRDYLILPGATIKFIDVGSVSGYFFGAAHMHHVARSSFTPASLSIFAAGSAGCS